MSVRGEGMGWRLYVDLVKQSAVAWVDDRAPTMGAALAFYSAFSLAPLLIIVIAVAGAVFGVDAARGAIVGQIAGLVGASAAEAIQSLLKAAQETTTSVFATVVGLVTMLVGATTILVELQDDLDLIWKAPKREGNSLLAILRARILSLGMILGVGFLLLISLVLSGAITAFEAYSESHFPGAALPLLHLWNPVLSVGAITVLFRDVVQVAAKRTDRLERRMDGRVHYGHSVQRGPICNRPLPWSERNRISVWCSRYAGRAPVMALLLCANFFARRRVHLRICNIPRAFSKSCVLCIGYAY